MHEKLNRREFITLSALATVGLSIVGCVPKLLEKTAGVAMQNANRMGASITPIALVDDCIRLALRSDAISDSYKESLTAHRDIVRAGGVMRSSDQHIPLLLSKCRDGWSSNPEGDLARILALATGGLFHRAVNNLLYPGGNIGPAQNPTDREIYQDAVVLHEIYLAKADASDSNAVVADSESFSTKDIHELFRGIEQRTFIRLHTFECDAEDIEGWIIKLVNWHKSNEPLLGRYAEVYNAPEPAKTQQLIDRANFYDRTDPIIELVRSLQYGTTEPAKDLDEAVEAAESQSQYSRALRKGFLHLQAANAYIANNIGEDALRNKLDIM